VEDLFALLSVTFKVLSCFEIAIPGWNLLVLQKAKIIFCSRDCSGNPFCWGKKIGVESPAQLHAGPYSMQLWLPKFLIGYFY
jgi:hypothetical protein